MTAILPYLQFLSGAGAGWLASWLFTLLRLNMPLPAVLPTDRVRRWLLVVTYTPRYARVTVLVLAGFVGIIAQFIIGVVTNGPVTPAHDLAIAAGIAATFSQIAHLPQLDGSMPVADETTVAPPPETGVVLHFPERTP